MTFQQMSSLLVNIYGFQELGEKGKGHSLLPHNLANRRYITMSLGPNSSKHTALISQG